MNFPLLSILKHKLRELILLWRYNEDHLQRRRMARARLWSAKKKKRVIGYLYVIICWYMHLYVTRVLPLVVMFSSFFFHFLLRTVPNTDWPITHSLWFQKVLLTFNKCQRKEERVFISRRVFIWDRHKTLIIPMAQCTDKRLTLWFCAEKVALLIDRRLTSGLTFVLFFFFSLRLRNQMITSEIRE